MLKERGGEGSRLKLEARCDDEGGQQSHVSGEACDRLKLYCVRALVGLIRSLQVQSSRAFRGPELGGCHGTS